MHPVGRPHPRSETARTVGHLVNAAATRCFHGLGVRATYRTAGYTCRQLININRTVLVSVLGYTRTLPSSRTRFLFILLYFLQGEVGGCPLQAQSTVFTQG